MTISCQNELINHRKQIEDLAKVYNSKEDDYLQQVKNSNDSKNELISNNNKLTVENKQLQDNYNSISTIKDNECKEKIQAEKIKCDTYKANINSLTGGFRKVLNNFENKVSGGIVGQIKTNLKTKCENEKETFKNIINNSKLKGGGKLKGGNPIIFMIGAIIKIVLMTLGTFIFDWWPIMMILSFYCVYLEYKMTLLTGQEVMGTPIIFLLGAYFCPCFWAIARVGMGWTTTKNTTPGLFNVLSKCTSDNITLNFNHYYGKPCKEPKCLYTSPACFEALFGNNESNMSIGSIFGSNSSSMSSMPSMPSMSNSSSIPGMSSISSLIK